MVLVRRFKVQVTSYIFDFPLDLYIMFSNRCLWVLVWVCNLGIGFYKSFAPFMISYEFIWCTLILFGYLILISWEHVFFHWIHYIQIFQISKIWGFHVGQFWWNLDFLEFVHGGCFPEIQNSCDVPFPILCEDLPDLINPSVPMDLKIDFTFFPVSRFYRFPWLSSHVHLLFSLWTQ